MSQEPRLWEVARGESAKVSAVHKSSAIRSQLPAGGVLDGPGDTLFVRNTGQSPFRLREEARRRTVLRCPRDM